MTTMPPDQLKSLIEGSIPQSTCDVTDLTGTQDHYRVSIRSPSFAGKMLVEQHRMVYDAVKAYGPGPGMPIHALSIETRTD